ncbi:hypothetical protein Nepgr_029992 [Nepenthes gracilis]|uniref:Uncharacterized protein n=1 Tax=Nepenthes gracilis TaxID=150966 RepID=A0AAD3TFD4_NEPGR|nr:hypothetical protein Nepgr_029992 [Nepenthes gracilis]
MTKEMDIAAIEEAMTSQLKGKDDLSSPDYPVQGQIPRLQERASPNYHGHNPISQVEVRSSPRYGDCSVSPHLEEMVGNSYDRQASISSCEREEDSLDYGHRIGPNSKPDVMDSLNCMYLKSK